MSPLSKRIALLLGISALLLAALFLFGCSRDSSLTMAPVGAGSTSTGPSRVLRIDDPGIQAATAAQNRATPDLMSRSGVLGTGTSVDERGNPVILIYTERPDVTGLPSRIDGFAARAFVTGKVVAYAKPGSGGPLKMGTSTGNDLECAAGTLGCVLLKGGVDYFLSNNHVFARENAASLGERIDAPGRYDGHPICSQTPIAGNLADFEPIQFQSRFKNPTNVIDCAIARPDAGLSYTSLEAGGYDPTSTVVAPAVGLAVKKTGRTSGLTHGTIQAINVTIQVGYSSGTATFVSQIQTPGNFIRSGDSGSLMVTESGNNPVGLCFAGSPQATFANPIGPVLTRFNATVK